MSTQQAKEDKFFYKHPGEDWKFKHSRYHARQWEHRKLPVMVREYSDHRAIFLTEREDGQPEQRWYFDLAASWTDPELLVKTLDRAIELYELKQLEQAFK